MRVRVGERSEPIVVFLTRRIPKSELNVLAINLDIGDVVLEDSGDVDLRERSQFDRIILSHAGSEIRVG